MNTPLLDIRNLAKHFPITAGFLGKTVGAIKAVDGVSFSVGQAETLGLVGESGCGKTTTGRLVLRLIERTAGDLRFHLDGRDVDLGSLAGEELRQFRRHMQLIFQDPFSSLNPRMTAMNIIGEPLRVHGASRAEIRDGVLRVTESVKLNREFLSRYPHAFSGGQRQRICIARALALNPRLVICDEPVSALDVSLQAQILNLLKDLQAQFGLAYLFIAHNLAVVEHISHRVAVMYAGRIVELAVTQALFHQSLHPYTMALLDAVPDPTPKAKSTRPLLQGEVANPANLPPGCSFHPRCAHCQERCRVEVPALRDLGDGHLAACHRAGEIPSRKAL